MVPVEKMQELGAVVNFWRARIASLNAELCMMHDLRAHTRPGGDRYAADRLLREIKKKAADIADAGQQLRNAERELDAATEDLGHLVRGASPQVASSGRAAH